MCNIRIQEDETATIKVQSIIQRQCPRWNGEDKAKNGVVKMLGCIGWKENPVDCGTPIGECCTELYDNDNDNDVSAEF